MGLVKLLFEFKNSLIPVAVSKGITLLEAAALNPNVPLRGACEGSLACTTCHVVLDKSIYKKCEAPTEREEDLLDTSKLLTSTSRLGCQVKVTPEMEGTIIKIPNINKNII
ncbi:adrenodoxin [Nematocida ausubeli]|uniref:Adrenodoxin n=1 Tax=Nematocida ausubeli (strain ATCC PRA-371 / ERTm2) TaxID=1913371 RepID=H8Z9K7_NEMA1|nr:adrenodoxin [Nematocida ausubeli]KAI5135536.1 ferredoxin-2, mitochondrial [Nematocida ausubeli]KAI5136631.1 ferredoxin-2, mitochondrial [Nematocida ausubeli]